VRGEKRLRECEDEEEREKNQEGDKEDVNGNVEELQ